MNLFVHRSQREKSSSIKTMISVSIKPVVYSELIDSLWFLVSWQRSLVCLGNFTNWLYGAPICICHINQWTNFTQQNWFYFKKYSSGRQCHFNGKGKYFTLLVETAMNLSFPQVKIWLINPESFIPAINPVECHNNKRSSNALLSHYNLLVEFLKLNTSQILLSCQGSSSFIKMQLLCVEILLSSMNKWVTYYKWKHKRTYTVDLLWWHHSFCCC